MNDDKRFVNSSCWVVPVVIAWVLAIVFTLFIPVVDEYHILLVLPVGFFLLLFYGSFQYGRWGASKKK